jgi:hypothetical protein
MATAKHKAPATAKRKPPAKKAAAKKAPVKKAAPKAKKVREGKAAGHKFLPGNQWWKARSSHGRNPIFANPEQLEAACNEYFQWVEDNPLWEEKVFCNQGIVTRTRVAKIRAMTLRGLCLFLGISQSAWVNYRELPDFLQVTREAEDQIYQQKFSGAAADLLNANIIARDLGLADKQDVSGSVTLSFNKDDADCL